jgi:hypothetical protein
MAKEILTYREMFLPSDFSKTCVALLWFADDNFFVENCTTSKCKKGEISSRNFQNMTIIRSQG